MTRLFHGFIVLAGSCAMTLIIGCGGSSSPKVTCDGGACGDAKKDTSGDGARAEAPVTSPDGPTVNRDGPTVTPDGPTVTSDTPAVTPDTPAVTPDTPAVTPDTPAVTPDGPSVTPDGLAVTPDTHPADVAAPADTQRDTALPGDGGSLDGGQDTAPVRLDVAADTVVDAPAPDAPADANVVDAGAGEVADGGCEGALCQNFEGDNPDAGLPSGLTPVGAASAWSLAVDGSNTVLEGMQTGGGGPDYVTAGVGTWTDQTIEVKVRFVDAAGANNAVRICGRSNASVSSAYCLYISTAAGDAGATPGSMSIVVRNGGTPTTLATQDNLAIAEGTWYTYRLSITGAGPVALQAQAVLNATTTITVNASDNASPYQTAGAVALGVRDVTAQFDDLVVTTP